MKWYDGLKLEMGSGKSESVEGGGEYKKKFTFLEFISLAQSPAIISRFIVCSFPPFGKTLLRKIDTKLWRIIGWWWKDVQSVWGRRRLFGERGVSFRPIRKRLRLEQL